jgi:transposase
MRPYSQDLRERVIAAVAAADAPQPEIADTFGVSLSFVETLWRRWRQTGSCAALPHAGGRERVLSKEERRLRVEVAKHPDVTVQELCERVAQAAGLRTSPSVMCRELPRVQLPRKKRHAMTARATRRG